MNDLVVVGGGQAGLAAAAHAAERGLRVVVCEKTDRFGGSAAFSAGILWTAPDVETMRAVVPDGDPELGRLLVEGLEPAVDRVRAAGVTVTERWYGQMGFGVAYRTDIHALHEHWQRVIVEAGGELRANTPVRSLRFSRRSRGRRRRRRGARGAARDRRLPGRLRAGQALPGLGRRPDADPLEPGQHRRRLPARGVGGRGGEPRPRRLLRAPGAGPADRVRARALPAADAVPLALLDPGRLPRPPVHRRVARRRGVQPDRAAAAGRARRAAVRRARAHRARDRPAVPARAGDRPVRGRAVAGREPDVGGHDRRADRRASRSGASIRSGWRGRSTRT